MTRLLLLLLAAPVRAAPDPALLRAACEGPGLLVQVPGEDAGEFKGLFGEPETRESVRERPGRGETRDAGGGRETTRESGRPKKVLHLRARGKDKEKAAAECRKSFPEFLRRRRSAGAVVAPSIEGELGEAERARLFAVLARAEPLSQLGKLRAEDVQRQSRLSRSLFDGEQDRPVAAARADALITQAELKLARQTVERAHAAARQGAIHRENLRRQAAGETQLGPGEFVPAHHAWVGPAAPSAAVPAGPSPAPGTGPSSVGTVPLADVPAPNPARGGSIIADVRAALSQLGVNIMGRELWRPRYGHNAPAHRPTRITVHHSAGSPSHTDQNTLQQIQAWENLHVSKGFGRMGYHWVINQRGNIVEGQPTELIGSHTAYANNGNVGICLTGNFDNQQPTQAMIDSLVGVGAYVAARYGMDTSSPNFLHGHQRYQRKSCPGNNVMRILHGLIRPEIVARAANAPRSGLQVAAVIRAGS